MTKFGGGCRCGQYRGGVARGGGAMPPLLGSFSFSWTLPGDWDSWLLDCFLLDDSSPEAAEWRLVYSTQATGGLLGAWSSNVSLLTTVTSQVKACLLGPCVL